MTPPLLAVVPLPRAGWFCYAQPLRVKVTLEVLRPGPQGDTAGWQPVKLPRSVKAIVVLNLQVGVRKCQLTMYRMVWAVAGGQGLGRGRRQG